MSNYPWTYKVKTATQEGILSHLHNCANDFSRPLSSRVDIKEYSGKLSDKAVTFEAWSDGALVGLVAAYFNCSIVPATAFITNASVLRSFTGQGIATALMNSCLAYAKELGVGKMSLEVSRTDTAAIKFYKKFSFEERGAIGAVLSMEADINKYVQIDKKDPGQ